MKSEKESRSGQERSYGSRPLTPEQILSTEEMEKAFAVIHPTDETLRRIPEVIQDEALRSEYIDKALSDFKEAAETPGTDKEKRARMKAAVKKWNDFLDKQKNKE